MYTTYGKIAIFILFTILLSGCLYPDNELSKNQVPNEGQLEAVQSAVEQYREQEGGLVPIRTKDNDTPIFQKYLIDFPKLKEANVLTEIPANAFENGGVYQYALITPEKNPRVKLIDLRISEVIRSVNIKLDIYRDEHMYPPFKEEIADGIYTIDYEKLGLENPPTVVSPYSKENLPIVMNTEGELYVDYRIDLNQALKTKNHKYETGDDIRYLLANNTPFVPVYSLPYTIKNEEPVFLHENK
ncbi:MULTISPECIES: hypothetical protein [Virgibacillus]|uniref:ABC transporter periplasmic binding protein yphF n=1 Tax=Virgibacillus chiguensis TaxID=411959 RepID=A0A1M5LHI8_9BACI|nr:MULTISPECIES: hypothetical protein [Virgibacillus]SHG64468.1 hypothetical protein SAMN05421807_101135 [Virgibacillus chiguensis]